MRIRLRGINSISKKLADGTRRTYWYAWKGGPPLRGEPGTPEFGGTAGAIIVGDEVWLGPFKGNRVARVKRGK